MKNIYQIGFTVSMLLLSIIVSSCGQNPKIKTITIVNGDTTISEGEFNEKEFAEMGKHIEISMTGDGDGSEKRIKKILISNENEENKANSESTNNNDQEEREVQVKKNENGMEEVTIDYNTIANDSIFLKNPNDVYQELYRKAREKAKQLRKVAMEAYLEAKEIKTKYMLDEFDDSEEDSDSESDKSSVKEKEKNHKNKSHKKEESESSDSDDLSDSDSDSDSEWSTGFVIFLLISKL